MQRTSSARWAGDLKAGKGTLKLGSGAFEGQYSFASRFETGVGTNPEELIAAAHAACFSMALSNELSKAGHVPRSVDTKATVELGMVGGGPQITGITLDCTTDVPGVQADVLARMAADLRANCIVSRALAAVPIRLVLNGTPQ